MRSKPTRHRGLVGITREGSGKVVGTARLIVRLPALSWLEFCSPRRGASISAEEQEDASLEGGASPGFLRRRGRLSVRCRIRIALGRWSGWWVDADMDRAIQS